jgi:hypothetical protein
MAIARLALSNPSANTDTLLHTAVRDSVVSVIATNKSTAATATIRIWIVPNNVVDPTGYAYQAYDTIIPVANSIETFRFALQTDDEIYVRSSTANVSFSLNGIHDSSGNYNKVTIDTVAPNAPSVGDVWVHPETNTVYFYSNSAWISAVGGSAGFAQETEPPFPDEGTVWVDINDDSLNQVDFPTVIYSPNQPTGLDVTDTGTIWVDSDNTLTPVSTRWIKTAVGGETTISGVGGNGITLSYDPGYEQVFLNGVLLSRNEDYTANNGTSIIFNQSLAAGDNIHIIAIDVIEISDTYTQSQVDELLAGAGFNPFLLAGM